MSEVNLSAVASADRSVRIDSEFFKKDDLKRLRDLERMPHASLKPLTRKIDVGYVGAMTAEYTADEVEPKLLQTRNIDEFIPNDNDLIHINRSFHDELKKSQIHTNDILIARSGSFGNAAIWLDKETANSSDIIIIEADAEQIEPCYLVAFLNSKYGRFQLERYASGAVQEHVNLTILENLKIAILSGGFQSKICAAVHEAYDMLMRSRKVYCDAEEMLLRELGFANWRPEDGGVSTRSFSEVAAAGRMDAEYFQPKYDELIARLREYDKSLGTIRGFTTALTYDFKVSNEKDVNYLEIGDVNVQNGGYRFSKVGVRDLPVNAKVRIEGGELLVSLVRPTRGAIAILDNDLPQGTNVCSGAFYVCKAKNELLSDILWLYLRCMRSLFEKYCKGTSYPTIELDDVGNFPVPHFNAVLQKKISKKVRESFRLRSESNRLLDLAKSAVELAIEKDEDAAMKQLSKGIV